MSRLSREDVERHLERLPREAWDRPSPPPPPWPWSDAEQHAPRRGVFLRPLAAAAAALALLAAGAGAGLLLARRPTGCARALQGRAAAPASALGPSRRRRGPQDATSTPPRDDGADHATGQAGHRSRFLEARDAHARRIARLDAVSGLREHLYRTSLPTVMPEPLGSASAQLLELVPDIIYEYRLAPFPGFVYVSPSVTAVLGYTPEQHYADPELGFRIVHPEDRARLEAIAAEPDEGRVYVIRRRTRSGGEVTTAQRVRVVRDEDGTVTSIVGVCRPIARGEPDWSVRFGPLSLDLVWHRATIDGRTLSLTPSEQQILAMLASSDRTVARREIVERLWGTYHASRERAVEVHISNLRKKLGTQPLRLVTVRGVGYRLVGVSEPDSAPRAVGRRPA